MKFGHWTDVAVGWVLLVVLENLSLCVCLCVWLMDGGARRNSCSGWPAAVDSKSRMLWLCGAIKYPDHRHRSTVTPACRFCAVFNLLDVEKMTAAPTDRRFTPILYLAKPLGGCRGYIWCIHHKSASCSAHSRTQSIEKHFVKNTAIELMQNVAFKLLYELCVTR